MIKLSFASDNKGITEVYINPAKVNYMKVNKENKNSKFGSVEVVMNNKSLVFENANIDLVSIIQESVDSIGN